MSNKRKILILAGNAIHLKVVETANKMGLYTIVVDNVVDSPSKAIANESLMFSVSDTDSIIEWCKKEQVNGVIDFCNDYSQKPCQIICETLGLPYFGTKEQVALFTEKNRFKKMCIENGVDVIPSYTIDDLDNKSIVYPVLVKPNDSRGSRGLSVCYNEVELKKGIEAAKKESKSGSVVIEKYMGNKQDFTVTYFVYNGIPRLVQFGDRYLGKKEDGLDRQAVCQFSPSYLLGEFLKTADTKVREMIKNVGIKNGPVFMQGFYDDECFRFYDPGIRFPGTEYERTVLETTGYNIIKKTLEYSLSIDNKNESIPEDLYLLNNHYCIQLFIDIRPGIVKKVCGLDALKRIKEVRFVSQRISEGTTVEPTGDVRQRMFEIIAVIPMPIDKEYAKGVIKKIQRSISVLDENNENMIVSPFNVDVVNNYYL